MEHIVFGPLSPATLSVIQFLIICYDFLRYYYSIFSNNIHDYGYIRGLALETVFLQARDVVQRIRLHVLVRPEDGAKEAWSVKQSYTTSFNMIAVAVGFLVLEVCSYYTDWRTSGRHCCADCHHGTVA